MLALHLYEVLMADVTWFDAVKGVTRKFVDKLDGTWAEQVDASVSVGQITIGDVLSMPISNIANCPSAVDSVALAASGVIKAGAGVLHKIIGVNTLASTQYIQIHNTTTVPADGAVPVIVIAVAASSNFSIDLAPFGKAFSTGICWCNSTTLATKTIGAANIWLNALYK